MFSYGGLGEVFRDEGRLTEALDAYQQLLKFAQDLAGDPDVPLAGFAHFEIGVILREWDDLDAAIEQLRKGVDLCREWRQGEALGIGLLELAETHRIRGEYAQAEATLREVRQVAASISPWATNLVEGFVARLALSRGEIDDVVRWAKRAGLDDPSCEIGYERFPECLPLIQMYIAIGEPGKGLALGDRLIRRDRACGRLGRVLDLLVLQVAAHDAMGQTNEALRVLAEAVELAGPERHVRPFKNAGPSLLPYLRSLPLSPHRDRLLATLSQPEKPGSAAPRAETALVEPLVDRELSILAVDRGRPIESRDRR